MTLLVSCDLDRTLIYSRDAMALGEPVGDPLCVEVYEGKDTSFISPRALKLLVELSQGAVFVPTTTRTTTQYHRVSFPDVRVDYAITTNGAALLVRGEPCPEWAADLRVRLADSASYDEAQGRLLPLLDRPWTTKVRNADGHFTYAVFRPTEADPAWFEELQVAAAALNWVLSVQGRKAYLIPTALTKEAALAEIVRRVGATTVAAAGDSLLDRGLLELAHVAIRPAHGELHDQGWSRDGLVVTGRSGGWAAEEIVERFLALQPRPQS